MSVGGVIAAVAAGLGLGGLVIYATRKPAAAPTSGGASTPGPGAARKDVNQQAYDACKSLGFVGQIFSGLYAALDTSPKWAALDAENRKLNGPVEVVNDYGPSEKSWWGIVPDNGPYVTLQGGVLRYKNGCTPYGGTPGWSKCAPGTHSMAGNTGIGESNSGGNPNCHIRCYTGHNQRFVFRARWDQFLSGTLVVMPLERRHIVGTGLSDDIKDGDLYIEGDPSTGTWFRGTFPLPVVGNAGAGWRAGIPFVCPEGQWPVWSGGVVRDYRSPCAPLGAKDFDIGAVLAAGGDPTYQRCTDATGKVVPCADRTTVTTQSLDGTTTTRDHRGT